MANFVMECPGCGKMVAAKTGIFARRKIECDCGHTIHVRTEKLTARTCPHCGNVFAYDQSDGRKMRCPSCRHIVVATDNETKTAEFSCGQCGVRLQATRGTEKFVCPVCDFENDVAQRLKKEK